MTRPQTVSAILVAMRAYAGACVELGMKSAIGDAAQREAATAMVLKAEANLLRATLAYGRRFEDPVVAVQEVIDRIEIASEGARTTWGCCGNNTRDGHKKTCSYPEILAARAATPKEEGE